MNDDSSRCFHCGGELPPVPLTDGAGASPLAFCCRGCHGAYLLITGSGLADFYRRRERQDTTALPALYQEPLTYSYLSRFVYPAAPFSAIDIVIGGIHCASCVWLNERMIGRLDGVHDVRVNYATGRARVVFDPAAVTPAAIFSRISQIGYAPRPYTTSAAAEGAAREQKDLLFRFGTAFFLTMQLMAYAFALYAGYLQGIDPAMKKFLQLFSLLVTTPVIFYCGSPFLTGAWRALSNGAANMDLLIAIGALSSYGYSVYATLAGGEVYFETAAMIVTLILAGRLLENAAKLRASGNVEHLLRLCHGQAHRMRGEAVETVDPSELQAGDLVAIGPGERFPVDGRIAAGTTDVDESPATGESAPVPKMVGDSVIAGSCNLTGAVTVACEREAADSFIARVARLVEEAQSRRAPIQGLADRISAIFIPVVVSLSMLTLLWDLFIAGQPFDAALMKALAVVVIACPCALGLATPTAIVAGTGAAAMRGVIFKGGDVLERLSRITLAVFDKTGTLTCGKPEIVSICPAPGMDYRQLLSLAVAVESVSLHPVGKAIAREAASRGISPPVARDVLAVAGGGVKGTVAGEEIAIGSAAFLTNLGVSGIPDDLTVPPSSIVVYAAQGSRYCGAFILKDCLRPDAGPLVSYLNEAGIGTALMSGDRQESVRHMATSVGIAAATGDLSPAEKAARIEEARVRGAAVLMVGDGINDAPALSAADVGCAVVGGTDIAIESSDLVLVRGDLDRISYAHRTACRTMAVVRQNLVWAFFYNAVGIPLAMTGRLTPIYAAAAMALSSVCVVANSLRLTEAKRG